MSVYTFQALISMSERWLTFGSMIYTKIWGIFHVCNLGSIGQIKETLWICLRTVSLGPLCSHILLYYFLQHAGRFPPSRAPEILCPLSSQIPLPISVFSILRICVPVFASFLSYFFIEVHWFITLYKFHVYNINFYFCIQHAHQQKVSFSLSPYSCCALPILPSIPTSSFLVTATLYSAFTFFLLFGLFTYFVCFFIAHIWVKSYGICLFPYGLLYLA